MKLGALFGFLVVVLVGVGWLGLDRMARIDADLERKVERRWEKLRLSSEALSYSILNNRVMMEIFLPKQGEEINPLLAQRADNSERITSLIASLESGIESERELLDAVKETRTPYVESYKRALDLRVQEGKYEEGRARHTPIVAMTANALEGNRERCLEAGMDDYVSKPVKPNELARALERLLADEWPAQAAEASGESADAAGRVAEVAGHALHAADLTAAGRTGEGD